MSSRKKTFLLGALLMSVVNLSMRTVSLYFSAFVLSRVGEEGVGLFTLLMNVFSFAVTFVSAGLGLAVTTTVASEVDVNAPYRHRAIMRCAVLYSGGLSLLASIATLFFSKNLSLTVIGDERATIPLAILALSLPSMALSSVFSGYFVAIRRVPVGASVQVLTQLFKILLTMLLLPAQNGLSTENAISRLCFASTISEIIGAIVLFLFYLLFLPKGRAVQKEKYRPLVPLLSITLPLAFSAYIRQALLTLEHSMIPRRLVKHAGASMESALADYGALHGMALPLLLYPLSPLSSFSSLLVPEFAELKSTNDRAKMGSIASRALSYTLSYASVICVFLFVFGEEISNLIYHTPTASYHLFVLAPIVPLMYLDHVTDAILKGIGEHVYSMWVNITDSLLSIVLLYFLLPRLGIFGYAVVIIVMEGYNFLLSFLRLRRRIRLSFSLISSFVYPMLCAMASSLFTTHLFHLNGSTTPYLFFFLKCIFFLCAFLFFYHLPNILFKRKLDRCQRKSILFQSRAHSLSHSRRE